MKSKADSHNQLQIKVGTARLAQIISATKFDFQDRI